MSEKIIIRHGIPTKYDQAPFGSHWKVVNPSDNSYDLYVQYSHKELDPKWEHMGTFSEHALGNEIIDMK